MTNNTGLGIMNYYVYNLNNVVKNHNHTTSNKHYWLYETK